MKRLTVLLAVASVAVSLAAVAPPAEAATYSSSGLRCTKVGTSHADRIVGTSHADVICGRGGNDTIYGQGGNDVIDAGSGNDTVRGGAGRDRVYAGSGRDNVNGDAGDDAITGQSGADTLTGSSGDDVIRGGAGNDDLGGGSGSDTLDGGAGTNWCDTPSEDHYTSCAVDLEGPEPLEIRLSRSTVDVTSRAQTVTAMVHASDDTGLSSVSVDLSSQSGLDTPNVGFSRRVSGTPRDGWWAVEVSVPQYLAPGVFDVSVGVVDRVSRHGSSGLSTQLTVVDTAPDVESPVLRSLTVSPGHVDVSTSEATVSVLAHVTDDTSGVDVVTTCAVRQGADGFQRMGNFCHAASRTRGNARDGWFDIRYTLPRNSLSGTYNFQIWVTDRAHTRSSTVWIGPDEVAYEHTHGIQDERPHVPDDGGRLVVNGLDDDLSPPDLTSLTTPAVIDAQHGARTATLDVAATDVEGITSIRARVFSEDAGANLTLETSYFPTLVSGTDQDGIWRFTVEVPGGTPPGRYYVEVGIEDQIHALHWSTPYLVAHSYQNFPAYRAYTPQQSASGGYFTIE